MKFLFALVLAALLGALTLGFSVGRKQVGARSEALTPVDANWERSLPADPEAATDAWLARMTPTALTSGRTFTNTRLAMLIVRVVALLATVGLLLFSGAAARLRDLSRRLSNRPPLQDAMVAVLLLLILFLVNLPIDTYAGYVLLRQEGFSQAPYLQWLRDSVVNWAVLTAFYVVGIVAIMALVRRYPRAWAPAAVAVYVVIRGIYVVAAPVYIEPLFNRITPLAEAPVKDAVLSLARANGIPAEDVFVRDASRQSRFFNAHVSGLGRTVRIVLDDNTIAATPLPEVQMVMAHEIGHAVLHHTAKGTVFDGVITAVGFLLIAWTMRRLIERFGPAWRLEGPGDSGAIVVFWCLFVLWWSYLALPINNGISRTQEMEADLYGLNASRQAMADASYMLRTADYVELDPPALKKWLLYDHPTPRERVRAAMRWRAEHLTLP